MRFIFSREVPVPIEIVLKKIPRELKRYGFQFLSDIKVDKELHESLGVDYKHCTILIISNLQLAYKAMLREEESAFLQFLPLLIYERNGKTILSAIRPSQLFPVLQTTVREDEALVIEKKLGDVMDALCRRNAAKEKNAEQQIYKSIYKAIA